jgi:hypothetical protein
VASVSIEEELWHLKVSDTRVGHLRTNVSKMLPTLLASADEVVE